jgi:nitrite reductase/ring-hydroxylating ferredoxin subunit
LSEANNLDKLDGFVPVLDEKELKEGEMKLISVEGIPVLFIKQFGKIFVIDNRCPHMGCGFSGGTLDGLVIVCPCHDWRFNLETDEYEDESSFKLVIYEWKVESGKIWVKLEDE